MASATSFSVPDQIRQLNDARKLVLSDVSYYPNVVRGILPIIGPNAAIELRRWGAEFLSEAFATPSLSNGEKETMQPYVLQTLESLVENEREDTQVLRSVVQTASSIYPLALRWIINNGYDTTTWGKMVAIKQKILRMWDNAPLSLRICCIKFAQRVVLAQSIGSGVEAKYGGTLDVSLDSIPLNHQTLDARNLEAEAMGLLDRMLGALQEDCDPLIVDATLNCLSILVRTRPATSNRILNALLNFNPLRLAQPPMSPRTRVVVRSMEKTARLLLIHISKRDPHSPMLPRIHQHIERMMRMAAEVFEDASRKRPLDAQQHNGDDAKRQRLGIMDLQVPLLGGGPHSLADVFTLIGTEALRSFDVSQVPAPMIAKITVNTLCGLDTQILARAVNGVRARLDALANTPAPELNPNTAPLGVDEDDDDYEPDFYQAEDTEQILNKLDGATSTALEIAGADGDLALKSFSLPQPPDLSPEQALSAGAGTVSRVLNMMKALDEPTARKDAPGFARLAASSWSREAWVTILTRLATRSCAGLEDVSIKDEGESIWKQSLGDNIRDILYRYVMEEFRRHIDVAVSWLCEEWYNDKMLQKAGKDAPLRYEKCALRLIDGFLPYLTPQDKVLTRFLSEIPELNATILSRIKHMCRDPSVVQLALTSLLYLVMMRPPVKEMALDTVQDIWSEFDDARPMATKYLTKYRPEFIKAATAPDDSDNTTQAASAAVVAT